MSDGTPFLRVAADRIGAPGSARIAGNNAIPRHQSRQLVLNHPDRREDGCHSNANCKSSDFESDSTGWESSIWRIPASISFGGNNATTPETDLGAGRCHAWGGNRRIGLLADPRPAEIRYPDRVKKNLSSAGALAHQGIPPTAHMPRCGALLNQCSGRFVMPPKICNLDVPESYNYEFKDSD